MSILSGYTDVDGIPVVNFVIFIEGTKMKNSMKNIVVGVFAKHAEVDLRDHHFERVHFIQAIN